MRQQAEGQGSSLQRGIGAAGAGFMLTEREGFRVVVGGDPEPFGLSLDGVATCLDGERAGGPRNRRRSPAGSASFTLARRAWRSIGHRRAAWALASA